MRPQKVQDIRRGLQPADPKLNDGVKDLLSICIELVSTTISQCRGLSSWATLRRQHSWVEDEAVVQILLIKPRLPNFSDFEIVILLYQEKQSPLSPLSPPGIGFVSGG